MVDCDILVVEDEALIAMDIEMTLEEAGHENIAVCHSVNEAMTQIDKSIPRLALLDFNLGKDTTSLPVAERLADNQVPVIFLSGYTESTVEIPEELSGAKRMAKPFRGDELVATAQGALNSG
ncbi:MAG: response regulator [Oricola sp.]|jgi:DNA-binding response OmpR family regulator|nr:MAG: response regulator [Oricola sp.]